MKKLLLILVAVCTISVAKAQDKTDYGVKFSGFVKTDMFYDTRVSTTAREGHFMMYPNPENLNTAGDDLNDRGSFNMLSIQSRLTAKITAPDVLGAKTSGVMEGAFFGAAESGINTFRLRHAYMQLDWENSQLIVGQYWHPMFALESFADVVSFNTGVPMQPFSRNPQIRFTQRFGGFSLAATAASQRDFTSIIEKNVATSDGLRYSTMPIMNLELKYKTDGFIVGANANYKTINPNPITAKNFVNDEYLNSMAFGGFVRFDAGSFKLRAQGVYAQNPTDMMMIGGFVSIPKDADKGINEYKNLNTLSALLDLTYGKSWQVGLFAGYSQNLGTDEDVSGGTAYGRATNMKNMFRVSPRLVYNAGKVRFAGEVEYTAASWGTAYDTKFVPQNTSDVNNIRILLATFLFF